MKGTRVMTTSTFYSALPAQRTSTQTSSKNSKIIYLPENPKIEDIQEHWDELITVDSTVAQDHDFCGCIIPNDPSIIAGPNNRWFILHPVEHADKYHKLKETELS